MTTLPLIARAILFDMDGVLVDSSAVIHRSWGRWALRHGLDPETLIHKAQGRRSRDTVSEQVPHLDLDAEVAILDQMELDDMDGVVAIPGAAALLASLVDVPWALVTSAGRELATRRLTAAGLPVPTVIVSGESVARGKPAPDGYLLGASSLGFAASECIVFEDAPAGAAAGRAAGARVVGVLTTHRADELPACAHQVRDLRDVIAAPDAAGIRLSFVAHNPSPL